MSPLRLVSFYIMESKSDWLRGWGSIGILLGIPFLFLDIWFVALLGVWLLLRRFEHDEGIWSFGYGLWFAFSIKYALALVWFWSTYPIEWLAVEVGDIQIAIIAFSWFMCAIALGLGGVVFGFGSRWLYRLFTPVATIHFFVLPLLWVVSEIVAAYAFSIVSIGPGGAITPAFSFGYSGYLLAQHEFFLSFAQVAGVYGLSYLFLLLGYSMYRYSTLQLTPVMRYGALVLSLLVLMVGFLPLNQYPSATADHMKVAVIDTWFPVTDLRTNEGRQSANAELYIAVDQAIGLEVDYIVLPEDSRLFDQALPVSTNKSVFRSRLGEVSAVIVDSGRFEQVDENPVLQAFLYDSIDDSVERVQKRYLVPQGEFLSSFSNLVLTLVGFGDTVEQVSQAISFQVGPYTDQSVLDADTPGVLFCFESVDPLGVRKVLAEHGEAPFIAHPISHAWFHEPVVLWRQLDTMLRVQSLWNQVYIVSAGGHVAGKVYAPNGSIYEPSVVASGEYWSVKVAEIPQI